MPTTQTITLTRGANGLTIEPEEFTLPRSQVDVIRISNTSTGDGPQPVVISLDLEEAKTLFRSIRVLPAAIAGVVAALASRNISSINTPTHEITLRKGESVEWVLPTNLPNLATLPLTPAGLKRRSFRLKTDPPHSDAGDHTSYHVEC